LEQTSSPPSAASATASTARAGLPWWRRLSLSARILLFSLAWIAALLGIGGLALDRTVTGTLVRNFDQRVAMTLPVMIAAAELDPYGDIRFNRPPVEPRFNEPYSGRYWQVSAKGRADFRSRSLWDRTLELDLEKSCANPCTSRYEGFDGEPLRLLERDAVLPGSTTVFRFAVAEEASALDRQVATVRQTLWVALGLLGLGLVLLSALQATVGLLPLKRLSAAIAEIRAGARTRVPEAAVPPEVAPLVGELNALLAHNEQVVEEGRMHAGNLAHALKTPISVLLNEAAEAGGDFAGLVAREASVMRRHVDHHLARARASARRAQSAARTPVWPSIERVARAIERIYAARGVVIDLAGDRAGVFRGEREDLEEMAGNLIDNAAKYGGGRVFVTVAEADGCVTLTVEDDGPGIPEGIEARLFERGLRLDTGEAGTGLGLAIVRDVAAMYGGEVSLAASEDLGGLMAVLRLPAAGHS
jgi:signal transduction histidine kinase